MVHIRRGTGACRKHWAAALDIGEDRVTDLLGERKQLLASAFSMETDVPCPSHIVEAEARHLARPQTEPNEQQYDGAIA